MNENIFNDISTKKPIFDDMLPINRPTLPEFDLFKEDYRKIFSSGMLTNHVHVQAFEQALKEYMKVRNVICVSCATLGLMLVQKCMGLTGEVITPSFTFPATTHSLLWNNLKPVFVDCDPQTFNMDITRIEELITDKTSAILGVYIFGNPLPMQALTAIANKHHLKLIFDSAHALGAKVDGCFAGNFGDAEVFSLAPSKLISSAEGGIIATNNDALAKDLRAARNYGSFGDYNCKIIGLNARMSEIHALIGLKSFPTLEQSISKRHELVDLYKSRLKNVPGISFQKITENNRTTFNYFSILIDQAVFTLSNQDVHHLLVEENIMTRIYFYPPVHKQDAYAEYYEQYKGSLPNTDAICQQILCLPLFSHMDYEMVSNVCTAIERIYENRYLLSQSMAAGTTESNASNLLTDKVKFSMVEDKTETKHLNLQIKEPSNKGE